MDFKCDELILGKKDADSRALNTEALSEEEIVALNSPEPTSPLPAYE